MADALPLQKLAFEVAVRINTVTPITPPALITMALLWADRALSVDQLLPLLERYAEGVEERGLPVTTTPIVTRETVLAGLASLQRHAVVTRYDGGREPVYLIQRRATDRGVVLPQQHPPLLPHPRHRRSRGERQPPRCRAAAA